MGPQKALFSGQNPLGGRLFGWFGRFGSHKTVGVTVTTDSPGDWKTRTSRGDGWHDFFGFGKVGWKVRGAASSRVC